MSHETMEVDNEQETDEEREQRALTLKAEGNKKYSSKKYQDAINLYTEAIDTFARPEFYGNRAAAYIAIYKFKQGLSDCISAIQLDPNYRKAYVRGVKCYTELADFKSAQKFAKGIINILALSLYHQIQLKTDGLDKFPHDNDLKQGYDRVEIIQDKLRRIDDKLSTASRKYNSFFEHHLNPQPMADHKDMDMKDKEEEKTDPQTQWKEQLTHTLSTADAKEVSIAISMINSLLNNDLSQSTDLKCTHIRALIIAQNYDSALSKSTNLLRWHKDSNKVTELRAIALFRCGNTDSAIKHLQVKQPESVRIFAPTLYPKSRSKSFAKIRTTAKRAHCSSYLSRSPYAMFRDIRPMWCYHRNCCCCIFQICWCSATILC